MFAKEITEPFDLFGPAHLIAMLLVAVVCIGFPLWMRGRPPRWQQRVAYGIAALMLLYRMCAPFIYNYYDDLPLIWNLPLQICGMLAVLNAYMLITRSYRVYHVAYFLTLAGAMQALITPDSFRAFPHVTYLLSVLTHGLIVLAVSYATLVFRFRPTWRSVAIVFVFGNLYMLALFPINKLLGTNFMYVMHKPPSASVLDYFGPWPWYLIVAELIGVVLFLFWYAPFAIKDWVKGRKPTYEQISGQAYEKALAADRAAHS
ncbi:TIGR02206 family membrane protein [Haliangium ochraceum]|uniref:TIGR02206 family membrane protein n=1 Tax=Haliangium ochraceum (strain DSM 14365 / JCM 11303 / SMP-2) TaxID=502025 RepID=D0LGQ3_HALO1|nr:TIGR02206 family membrane protein [Haliangium ochraceum]ACY12799.1 conserved hypothetical protein [Haliangium ochraceum DSM 14365]